MRRDFNYDSDLLLEDGLDSAGADSPIDATQAGKVLNVAKVVDFGAGLFDGNMIIDVEDMEVGTDEYYTFTFQVSAASFSGDIQDQTGIKLGIAASLIGTTDSADGRYVVPVTNEKAGTIYRYGRVYITVYNGTGETILPRVWLSKK